MTSEQMPADLREVYQALQQQVLWLIAKRKIYVELYSDKETVALLNRASPPTFRTVQDALFADTVMSLARMGDPPRSAGKDNLSFRRLKKILEEHFDGEISSSCSKLVDAFVDESEPLRTIRNRQLAHSDLKTVLGANTDPLPGVSLALIGSLLDRAAEILNELAGAILDSHTTYDDVDSGFSAEGLLIALRLAEERHFNTQT